MHLAVLLAYLALAIVLTWPTVTHLATHLPGDGGDDPAIAWNMWWVKHALLTLHTSPLHTDAMFYPIGINLAFYTLTVLNALTAMPLTVTLGVVAACNLHTWFTMVAGGYGAFLLARQLGNRAAPSAVAGMCYAFASSQLFYISLGQFNIASSHWLPYVILFVMKSRRDLHSLRSPLLAALFLVMQSWAEMTYASFALVFIALTVVCEVIASIRARRIGNPAGRCAGGQVSMAVVEGGYGGPPGDAIPGSDTHDAETSGPASVRSASQRRQPATPIRRHILTSSALVALRNLALAAGLFGLGIAPLLAAMLPDMQAEGDFWVQGSGFAEAFSADLLGFLVPTMHHPLLGRLVLGTGIAAFDKGQHIYLGPTLLALAAVGTLAGWRKRLRSTRFWLVATLFFAWLSLGPTMHINGVDTHIPGPFALLQSLPFFKGNRYPSRYSVLLVLSLAMLAAPGITILAHKIARWRKPAAGAPGSTVWLSLALAGLLMAEHLSLPLPQSDMRAPAAYYALAAEPPGTLLDIPIAWRNGFRITGPLDPGFMFGQFYQTIHARRLLQGNTSRNPESKFQYFTEAPVLNSLLALETGHALPTGRLEADRALAGDVLRFFDIRHIVVRRGPGADVNRSAVPEATLPYIDAALPVERIYADGALTMYRVALPPLPRDVLVDAAAPLARLYLAEGWGPLADRQADGPTDGQAGAVPLLWAQRPGVRLLAPLAGGATRLSARLVAPGDGQRLSVRLNGWRSAAIPLEPGWGEYALDLPAEAVHSGLNDVWLDFERLYPVASLACSAGETPSPLRHQDTKSPPTAPDSSVSLCLGGDSGASIVSLVVHSAGQEVGDFAHIYLNGADASPDERGYNVVVLAPDGALQTAAFDTHLDPTASRRLAEFIAAAPEGARVAVAAADEASMQLGEEGVAALRSLGATGDLRGKFRWSHAIIGVKGRAPGAALEAMDGLRPVTLALGPAISAPSVAAGAAWLRFEAVE